MKVKLLLIPSLLLILQACSTTLTAVGSTVRVVDDKEKYDCRFISTVSGFDTFGANTGHEAENTMNEIRNKAAKLDANGIKILHMETTFQGTSATAEVLRCKFKD